MHSELSATQSEIQNTSGVSGQSEANDVASMRLKYVPSKLRR
jgi:hypothetical protein